MRLGFVTFVTFGLLMATAIFACGGDELAPVSDPPTQSQRATEPSAQQGDEERPSSGQQTRPREAGRLAESGTDARTNEVEKEPPPEDSTGDETAVQEPEREAGETPDATLDAEVEDAEPEPEDAEPEPEEAPEDLTGVPAVVMEDADVRLRPGLSWRVIDQLGAGEDVVAVGSAGDWIRISYRGDSEGWILTRALDLGGIYPWDLPEAYAPAITAIWRGVEYGVMGRSADDAEVRLLRLTDGPAKVLSAVIDEVSLQGDDIALDDLPILILIGGETVVFPGDDFSLGQGRILPSSDQLRWLDDGSLLAHNDTQVWRWNPEGDKIEFDSRPPGPAWFSPDGRRLVILTCAEERTSCRQVTDLTISPLDGSPAISLRQALDASGQLSDLSGFVVRFPHDLKWSSDGSSVLVATWVEGGGLIGPAVILGMDGAVRVFRLPPDYWPQDKFCMPAQFAHDREVNWIRRSENTVALLLLCRTDDEVWDYYYVVVNEGGEFLGLERDEPAASQREGDQRPALVHPQVLLGDNFKVLGSYTRLHAIVVGGERQELYIFDRSEQRLHPIALDVSGMPLDFQALADRASGWDVYWSGHSHAALFMLAGQVDIRASFLIDISDSTATPIELGSARRWPCYSTGSWSPDGTVFQFELEEWPPRSGPRDNFRIDGLAARVDVVAERQFLTSEGRVLTIQRSVVSSNNGGRTNLGEWSPNGAWFSIGGHLLVFSQCYSGA